MTHLALSFLLSFALAGIPASPVFLHHPSQQRQPGARQGKFDSAKAYSYLVKQTQFGPRDPGSTAHERCLKFLREELGKYADVVVPQAFSYAVPKWKRVQLTNLLASFNTRATNRLFISAHWDTRPWADQDPEKKNWTKPIVGANDGASGVAIILELARQLRQFPPAVGVDLVLFDGEDLGTSGFGGSFSIGAQHFAKNRPPGFNPRFGINIDMVGDRNLEIEREQNSERLAPEIQNLIFSTARRLMLPGFIDSPGNEITDDHLPLNDAGIPTVDLIDFKYPDGSNKYWHTMADTPDKCSAESLGVIGTLLLEIIYTQQ
ncbi:MAG: M28 family peptidase [Ignavibacteriales bacterium]|nr:M28 family peptidase [Ignavibacteriales bacterium]